MAKSEHTRRYGSCGIISLIHHLGHLYTPVGQLVIFESQRLSLSFLVSLEHEPTEIFKDVNMKVPQIRMPIILEVGTSHLRITSVCGTGVEQE